MKGRLLSFCLLLLCLPLWGQDYLHRNFYGQGENREQALSSLLNQIGQSVSFENPALIQTYQADISRFAVEQQQNGRMVLSYSGTQLDALFQTRQNRAEGILDQGRKAREDAVKKTYYTWAWYYLCSLPPEHQLPGKAALKTWLVQHPDTAPAKLPIPMTHIESEVAAIRRLVGDLYAPVSTPVPAPAPVKAPQEKTLVQEESHPRTGQSAIGAGTPPFRTVDGEPIPVGPVGLPPVREEQPLPQQVSPLQFSVLATFTLAPEPAPGLLLAVGKKWGGVVSFHSNFKTVHPAYSALSSGPRTDGSGYIWPGGKSQVSVLSLTAGGSYRINNWLGLYATAGYGYRNIFWDDTDGQWVRMEDLSARGLAVTAGTLLSWKHLCGSIGLSTIAFQTLGVSVGIGLTF